MGMQKTIKIEVGSTTPLWPYAVVQVIEAVMQEGEAEGKSGWEEQYSSSHIHRAQDHLDSYFRNGAAEEDHLAHAFCRLMMANAIERGYVGKGDE
uniref:dATP/dGTP diphosphohydrolase N-terminal domain-containing protein n=1 Tax=viral metagenome TaxID=1070528 RepID=A0A6M3JT89_9ZZZZ